MPKDSQGNYHNSTQRAMAADRMHKPPAKKPPIDLPAPVASPAAEHLRDMQSEMGGKHLHIHQGEDGSLVSHSMGESGEPEMHTHADVQELKDQMDQFFNEELAEPESGETY